MTIKKTKNDLEKQNWVLRKTRDTLTALYKDLDKKNEKLKRFDELKSQFVANVSHELKNPLFVINESLSVILDGFVGEINPEQKKMIKIGNDNVARLLRLVTDMLDLSKIESGKMEMRREKFNMSELVDETLSGFEGEIAKKQITLKKDIPSYEDFIWADRDRISEVIINLLNNAIKYTPENGNIGVKLEDAKEEIRFEISDTGSGILKEDYSKIFDKFERVTLGKQDGTGLGLPISKDIVEFHRGKIWVESEFGKGSKFSFVLPKDLRGGVRTS
ncbi:MAG: HAMP domain-containing sensor histidine kinase [Candidatus Omnitrophota bacterium]|nr:cell wall metabolism sensor histidine kinase WalK [Candidatus Omnitrophota bacterium]MBU1894673.1 cell wall metabolism sensor histidine kinase WalK [Candidatus Omnitrophota bacterium]